MRKTSIKWISCFLSVMLLVSCFMVQNGHAALKVNDEDILHYRDEDQEFGDTHQFFNKNDNKWYMLYMYMNERTGNLVNRILVSDDQIHWERVTIDTMTMPRLFFNDVIEYNGNYYTYSPKSTLGSVCNYEEAYVRPVNLDKGFGQGWKIADESFFIYQDMDTYYGGIRDLCVFRDEEAKKYYCLAIGYKDYFHWGAGEGMEPYLLLFESAGDSPQYFSKPIELMEFEHLYDGDPECPYMAKIGNRWYMFASPAGPTYRYMGKFTYWMGGENESLLDIDWMDIDKIELSGEELCAGRLSQDGEGNWILYGWIPDGWDDNTSWGGHLTFPYLITANEDGTLRTQLQPSYDAKIRGEMLTETKADLATDFEFTLPEDRVDIEIAFSGFDKGEFHVTGYSEDKENKYDIVLDAKKNKINITINNMPGASIVVPKGTFTEQNELRIILEKDMIECFINDSFALPVRSSYRFNTNCTTVINAMENVQVESLKIYHLNAPSEIE